MDNEDLVIIIGGGVAGLILAQGLKYRGIPFRVFERDESLSARSQGYRFRLDDASLHDLQATLSPHLWALIEKTCATPRDTQVRAIIDAHAGETKRTFPDADGSGVDRRNWNIDRTWFREALSLGIEDDVVFGKGFESYEFLGERSVKVTFTDQTSVIGRLLVAADGVHSRVRKQFLPHFKVLDIERYVVWGKTPITAECLSKFPAHLLEYYYAFMVDFSNGPAMSANFAPIKWDIDIAAASDGKLTRKGDYMFWAASTEIPPNIDALSSGNTKARMDYVLAITKDWHPRLRSLLELQDPNSPYGIHILSAPPETPDWDTDARIILAGDAIHMMSPSGGSGGLTAVQDVAALCKVIQDVEAAKGKGDTVERMRVGIKGYEKDMRKRAKKTIDFSFEGGKIAWRGKEWWEYNEV